MTIFSLFSSAPPRLRVEIALPLLPGASIYQQLGIPLDAKLPHPTGQSVGVIPAQVSLLKELL